MPPYIQEQPWKNPPEYGLILSGDMIVDMKSNKILSVIVTELFPREKERTILLANISILFYKAWNDQVKYNALNYFIIK